MAKQVLDLRAGIMTSVDDLAPVPSSIVNFQVDAAGVNRKRPALTTYATTGMDATAVILSMFVFQTWLIAATRDSVSGARKLWAMSQSALTIWQALSDATVATQIDGGLRPVFSEDGIRVVVAGGGAIQQWQGVGLSSRLGAGPTCTHIVAIGNRLVANNTLFPQEYDWSNLGDGAHNVWDALAIDNADARPDPVVAIGENLRELHIFGSTTTQIYSVGVDPLAPFDNAAAADVGVSGPYSVVRLDQAFAFLDNRRRFVISDGRTLTVISDPIERELRQLTTISDCWGYREEFEQFSNIVWTFPAAARTWSFNTARNTWAERKFYIAPFNGPMPQNCYIHWPAANLHLIGSTTANTLYKLDSSSRADSIGTMLAERYTGWEDLGTKSYKRDEYLNVIIRRGESPLGGPESSLEIRCRDDGGPWSDFDFILLGQPADAEQTIKVRLGGCFYRRQWHFRYSGSDNFSLVSAEQIFEDLESQEAA